MEILAHILTALVTLEHFYILYLEMFTIESKSGVRQSRVIQRLLAAGIIFGYAINQISVIYFFLGCVIIAAVFGAVTTKNKGILVK